MGAALREWFRERGKAGDYSVARTVMDLFGYRNKVGLEVALVALEEGWRERRFTVAEINRIARPCRMEDAMNPYLKSPTA